VKPGTPLPSLAGLRYKTKLIVLDFVAHWSAEEALWRGPTNRMARAWARDLTWVEVLVWEQERGANPRLARALPHPHVLKDASGFLGRWLDSHGVDSLPLTLLFSAERRLLFSGQPFELPGVLEAVRGNRFDAGATYALQQKRDAEAAERARLVAKLTALEKAGKWRDAIALIDSTTGTFVPEHRAGLLVRRFKILHKNALSEALAYARTLEADPLAAEFPWLLHDLALEVADREKPSRTEYVFAIGLMERLLLRNPTRPSYWDTLAELRSESGDTKGALVAQNQAVRFINNQLDLTDAERASILRWQANYRRAAVTPPPVRVGPPPVRRR
jgi:hypothetical protein